jgi:exodeoxyribonuclease-3
LEAKKPNVLLLQELKGAEFPSAWFKDQGYESVSVTRKTYNGVAILSRSPIGIVSTTLLGDEADSHARFLEVLIQDIRIVNIRRTTSRRLYLSCEMGYRFGACQPRSS